MRQKHCGNKLCFLTMSVCTYLWCDILKAWKLSTYRPVVVTFIEAIAPTKVGIKSCICVRECFICTCIWLHVFKLRVTLETMIKQTQRNNRTEIEIATYVAISVIWADYLFPYFYCNPYFLLQIQIFTHCVHFI